MATVAKRERKDDEQASKTAKAEQTSTEATNQPAVSGSQESLESAVRQPDKKSKPAPKQPVKTAQGQIVFYRQGERVLTGIVTRVLEKNIHLVYFDDRTSGRGEQRLNVKQGLSDGDYWHVSEELESAIILERAGIRSA